MTRAKSIKHFIAKAEKVRIINLPSKSKKRNKIYQENKKIAKITRNIKIAKLSKILSKEDIKIVPDEEILAIRTVKKKAKLKVKRKRNNITNYIRRKLKKQAELRIEPTFNTPEKRIRLTDVYELNQEVVSVMDRFEVSINIIFNRFHKLTYIL